MSNWRCLLLSLFYFFWRFPRVQTLLHGWWLVESSVYRGNVTQILYLLCYENNAKNIEHWTKGDCRVATPWHYFIIILIYIFACCYLVTYCFCIPLLLLFLYNVITSFVLYSNALCNSKRLTISRMNVYTAVSYLSILYGTWRQFLESGDVHCWLEMYVCSYTSVFILQSW